MFKPNDIREFIDTFPGFTALVLVDKEPNEKVIGIVQGYCRLRTFAREYLEGLKVSDNVLSEHSKWRPRICVNVNESLSLGRNREQLVNWLDTQEVELLPYTEMITQGKNQRLASVLSHGVGNGVLIADVELSERMAEQIFVEYALGGLAFGTTIFFFESRSHGQEPIGCIVSRGLLNSDYLLNFDNDLFAITKRPCWLGGLKCTPYSPEVPRRRFKFHRSQSFENLYPRDHTHSFADLINSFLFEAYRKELPVTWAILE